MRRRRENDMFFEGAGKGAGRMKHVQQQRLETPHRLVAVFPIPFRRQTGDLWGARSLCKIIQRGAWEIKMETINRILEQGSGFPAQIEDAQGPSRGEWHRNMETIRPEIMRRLIPELEDDEIGVLGRSLRQSPCRTVNTVPREADLGAARRHRKRATRTRRTIEECLMLHGQT
ncbi:hypothetical protein [Belnapia rosea]|uniref:hypothetical protein n=1 Tax=Belnapia rosea TaxID=938405 RepID=UPI00210CCD39|nr:hypothetical protein [Belnapia rosea]